MAKWKINQAGLKSEFNYQTGDRDGEAVWRFEQDERPFLEQAAREREMGYLDNNSKMKKFATIPEIVAIDIKLKHGIDIHEPDFLHDDEKKAKFFSIIQNDYSHLVINNR
jgi:hypothetical protein